MADIVDQISDLKPRELAAWIRSHAADLSSDEAVELQQYVGELTVRMGGGGNALNEVNAALDEELDKAESESGEAVDAVETATAEAVRRAVAASQPGGTPLDLSDIRDMAPEHMTSAEKVDFAREVEEKAREEYQKQVREQLQQTSDMSESEADDAANEATTSTFESAAGGTPIWVLQEFGSPLTADQKQRAVEYWNDLHGTWSVIQDFDTDLAPILAEPTGEAHSIIQAAILDIEPTEAFQIELPGRDPFTVTKGTVELLKSEYGFSNDAITRLLRLTSIYNDKDEPIDQLWQPMAALFAATGQASGLGEQEEAAQAEQSADEPFQVPGNPSLGGYPAPPTQPVDGTQFMLPATPQVMDPTTASFGNLSMYYKEGLELYGDPTLSFLHALNRGLAARIAASGGDPGKVGGADNAEALRLLVKGGLIAKGATPFEQIGGDAVNSSVLGYLQRYFDAQFTEEQLKARAKEESRAAMVRAMPDPVAVREQVTELWQNLFLTNPSDEIVGAFQDELSKAISSSDPEQNIDVTARIQAWLKGQPAYNEMYGNKPAGLSESEYQSQFVAGAQSMLGAQATADEAVQAGMRSGDYQTTIGQIAGQKSSLDNSTFQERLAIAKNTFADML